MYNHLHLMNSHHLIVWYLIITFSAHQPHPTSNLMVANGIRYKYPRSALTSGMQPMFSICPSFPNYIILRYFTSDLLPHQPPLVSYLTNGERHASGLFGTHSTYVIYVFYAFKPLAFTYIFAKYTTLTFRFITPGRAHNPRTVHGNC